MALVLHAKFSEGSGTSAANSVDPAQVGVLEGSTLPSWVDGALSFNGVEAGSIVRFPEAAPTMISGALTVALWVKTGDLMPGPILDVNQKEMISRGGGNFHFGFEGESASGVEKIAFGDMEDWDDVNTLTYWNKYVQGGTSNLVRSTDKYNGTYAASFVIDASGNDVEINKSFSVTAGVPVELTFRHKESNAAFFRYWLRDDAADPDTFLHSDGTWSSGFVYLAAPHADTYTEFSVKFTPENTGTITFGIGGHDASETYYLDAAHAGQYFVWMRCYLKAADSTYVETEVRDNNPDPGYRDDEWHHVLVRFDPSSGPAVADGKLQLWIDGALIDDEAGHTVDELKISGIEDWWTVGGAKSTSTSVISRNLASTIDNVKIWDEYVSDATIAREANPSEGSMAPAVYHYYLKG